MKTQGSRQGRLMALVLPLVASSGALAQSGAAATSPGEAILPNTVLTRPISPSAPDAAVISRGQYLVAVGDCMSCHLRPGGEPLAGGLGLQTPFGVIYSSNITSDRETGVGTWTSEQFYQAMHDGKGVHGENLYPAFPYPWFHLATREDDDAILAFLKTTPAVRYTPPQNGLHWPMDIRATVKFWNALYLGSKDFRQEPGQSAEWNRGAYLVTGLGHCGGCHTPKNSLGADKSGHLFEGGKLDNWVAPDLTANERTGLGAWSISDIAEYLRNGRNSRAAAGGAMADVVTYSTSLMTDADRRAIAVYLKSLAPSPSQTAGTPDAAAMNRGAAIYSDACASCHLENGVGQPGYFPPLGENAVVQQADSTSLQHMILAGNRIGTSAERPTALTMPSFAWKLSDAEIADVATYIRHSWGNDAPAVSASDVADLRKRLDLDRLHLTEMSGDRN
jgi:mono/diheme cytochrome c family protein